MPLSDDLLDALEEMSEKIAFILSAMPGQYQTRPSSKQFRRIPTYYSPLK